MIVMINRPVLLVWDWCNSLGREHNYAEARKSTRRTIAHWLCRKVRVFLIWYLSPTGAPYTKTMDPYGTPGQLNPPTISRLATLAMLHRHDVIIGLIFIWDAAYLNLRRWLFAIGVSFYVVLGDCQFRARNFTRPINALGRKKGKLRIPTVWDLRLRLQNSMLASMWILKHFVFAAAVNTSY